MGEGIKPSTQHLVKLGLEAKLSKKLIEEIIERTKDALAKWKDLAKTYGIGKANVKLISNTLGG